MMIVCGGDGCRLLETQSAILIEWHCYNKHETEFQIKYLERFTAGQYFYYNV